MARVIRTVALWTICRGEVAHMVGKVEKAIVEILKAEGRLHSGDLCQRVEDCTKKGESGIYKQIGEMVRTRELVQESDVDDRRCLWTFLPARQMEKSDLDVFKKLVEDIRVYSEQGEIELARICFCDIADHIDKHRLTDWSTSECIRVLLLNYLLPKQIQEDTVKCNDSAQLEKVETQLMGCILENEWKEEEADRMDEGLETGYLWLLRRYLGQLQSNNEIGYYKALVQAFPRIVQVLYLDTIASNTPGADAKNILVNYYYPLFDKQFFPPQDKNRLEEYGEIKEGVDEMRKKLFDYSLEALLSPKDLKYNKIRSYLITNDLKMFDDQERRDIKKRVINELSDDDEKRELLQDLIPLFRE